MSPQPESPSDTSVVACTAQNEFAPDERAILLKLAHESILSALERRELSLTAPSPHLAEPRGAFTTLYFHDALRGCVGYVFRLLPSTALCLKLRALPPSRTRVSRRSRLRKPQDWMFL
jgi:hypothetical protein